MLKKSSQVVLALTIAAFAVETVGQQAGSCGPYVVSSSPETELTQLGTAPILNFCLAPDPTAPGSYVGVATVISSGPTLRSFRWTPGQAPAPSNLVPVSMPSQTVDAELAWAPDANGQLTLVHQRVFTTAGGTTSELLISKLDPVSLQFSSEVVVQQLLQAGTVASCLGKIGGVDVILFYSLGSGYVVADIDTDAASPTYGQMTNQRTLPLPAFVTDVTPVPDLAGETRSLLYVENLFGSTLSYFPVADPGAMPVGTTADGLRVTFLTPIITGAAMLDPSRFVVTVDNFSHERFQMLSVSSTRASLGQTITYDVRFPSNDPAHFELFYSLSGLAQPPMPVSGPVLGNLCIDPVGMGIDVRMSNGLGVESFQLTVPNSSVALGTILHVQPCAIEIGGSAFYLGNRGTLEVVR